MERLTRKSDSGMVWFVDREHESGYVEREPCEMHAHHARLAIAKLAEYEDIGLTPEQLRTIDRMYAEKCRELAESYKNSFSGIEMVKIWAKL